MPTKVDPGTLAIGSGKAAQDSISVSSLDFAHLIDFQAALSAHVNDPDGAHPASAISVQDVYAKYDGVNAEIVFDEISDLVPDYPNAIGESRSVPNSGVPDWGDLDTYSKTGGFTCDTANHGHTSWGGGNQGGTPGDWIAETHCLIPDTVTGCVITGTLYPADRGYLVLLYATKGVFDNSGDTIEVGKLNLASNFDELRRRNPAVGYQQLDYTASENHWDPGTDIFSLTYRLPMLKEYDAGVPYTTYDFNYLQFQLARYTATLDLTATPFDIGTDVDFGSLKLFHFKSYTNVAGANYSASNLYGSHGKLDIYSDTSPAAPTLNEAGGEVLINAAYPLGTETTSVVANADLTTPNNLAAGTAIFAGDSTDRGKILTITGSSQGNNGTYQVLNEVDASNVKVYPNFPGTLPDTVTPQVQIEGANVVRLSGIAHYGPDNGFYVDQTFITTPDFWNNSYLTSDVADPKVSSEYLSDKSPLSYDFSDFGVVVKDIPYHLDLSSVSLSKGDGPAIDTSASHRATFISQESLVVRKGGSSYLSRVSHIVRSPFTTMQDYSSNPVGILLVDVYGQEISSKMKEEFYTEQYRYDLGTDLLEFIKYPIIPYDRSAPNFGDDGVVSGSNTFTSATASFTSADTGRIINIAKRPKLYWTDRQDDQIQRSNLDGAFVETVYSWGQNPNGIALDTVNGKIYWADFNYQEVKRMNFDGSGFETVWSGQQVYKIALDVDAGKIYYSDRGDHWIKRANMSDGSSKESLINYDDVDCVFLDIDAGKIYYTTGSPGLNTISRANMSDGSSIEVLYTVTSPEWIPDFAFDLIHGYIYFTVIGPSGRIMRCDLDGSNDVTITPSVMAYNIEIDVDGGKLYWSDVTSNVIKWSDLDGSNIESIISVTSGSESVRDMALMLESSFESYTATYVNGTEISVSPDWPSVDGVMREWRFPVQFDSDADLSTFTQKELQVASGQLVVPENDYTAGWALPSAGQFDYSGLAGGDPADTIRWYTRLFDTGGPTNVGRFRIKGIHQKDFGVTGPFTGDLPTDHEGDTISGEGGSVGGGVVVLVKIPGVTGWLDLGRSNGDPNIDKTKDYYGCLVQSNQIENLVDGLTDSNAIALDINASKMYWTDTVTSKIQRSDLDGSNVEDIYTASDAWGIALDTNADKMYFTSPGANKIRKADLDGSNVEDLVDTGSGLPTSIALDINAGKMYWISFGPPNHIYRANLDGSMVETLVSNIGANPYGIALDVDAGYMYWSDTAESYIRRADLDGSFVDIVVEDALSPNGIALDLEEGKIYWQGLSQINRCDLDGSNREDSITPRGLTKGKGLALDTDSRKIYWTNYNHHKIQKTSMDGMSIYTYTTDYYTQDNGLGEYPIAIRIGLIKDGYGYWNDVVTIEWLPYT